MQISESDEKCKGFEDDHRYLAGWATNGNAYGFNVGSYPNEYDFEGLIGENPLRLKGYRHTDDSFIVVNFDFVPDSDICRAE